MRWITLLLLLACWLPAPPALTQAPTPAAGDKVDYAAVTPGRGLHFPADFGAHPEHRTEWWYVTGWLDTPDQVRLGFQVTFFRSRTGHAPGNPSRFAPHQLIIAHAALSDPRVGKLLHDQKSARAGFGLAYAKQGNTDVRLENWSLVRDASGRYAARVPGRDFQLELDFEPTQPLLVQGEAGFSRKGPRPEQASYYYSEPHLKVSGTISGKFGRQGQPVRVQGQAWLDHEWSSTVLDEHASGWDWVGANLDDGSALMMFRIRAKNGAQIWAHATLRDARGRIRHFPPSQVSYLPERSWRSPRTGATYPVAGTFTTGELRWRLLPLQDDQELDSRLSTGAVYWEGAVTLEKDGKPAGRGYLELTGYQKALKL